MKTTLRTLTVVALLALPCFSVVTAAERSLSSDVKLEPLSKPGAYRATVEITDAASGEVLSAPSIAFMTGGPAKTKTTLASGEEVLFTVQVDSSGSSASYTAEIRSGDRLVSVQKATIALAH